MYSLHLLLSHLHYKSAYTEIVFLQHPKVRIFTLLGPKILSWNSNNSTLNTLWAYPWHGMDYTLPKKGNFGIILVGKFSNILILDWLNFNLWITVFPDSFKIPRLFDIFFFQNSVTGKSCLIFPSFPALVGNPHQYINIYLSTHSPLPLFAGEWRDISLLLISSYPLSQIYWGCHLIQPFVVSKKYRATLN